VDASIRILVSNGCIVAQDICENNLPIYDVHTQYRYSQGGQALASCRDQGERMFWVTTVLQSLVLPPGIFIVLGLVVVLLIAGRKARAAMWVALVALVAGLALSVEPVSNALLLPLENRYEPLTGAPAESGEGESEDATATERSLPERVQGATHIVVLGGGTVPGSPEATASTLHPDALKRAVYSHQLHWELGLPVVLTGGRAAGLEDAPPEAQVAADLLLSLGSTQDQLLLETESRDTWENAQFVDGMICNSRVILVTSAYHMTRAVRSFAAHGFTVIPAPTDYKAERGGYRFVSFLPSIESFRESTIALHEYLGLLYYRFRTPDPERAVVRP
jgi:uncharacterized SAM-binding protein YcdF (DUF218 family)